MRGRYIRRHLVFLRPDRFPVTEPMRLIRSLLVRRLLSGGIKKAACFAYPHLRLWRRSISRLTLSSEWDFRRRRGRGSTLSPRPRSRAGSGRAKALPDPYQEYLAVVRNSQLISLIRQTPGSKDLGRMEKYALRSDPMEGQTSCILPLTPR